MNHITIDSDDIAGLAKLMDEHAGECGTGVNDEGEKTFILVKANTVEVTTYQKNKWVRRRTYHRDGTTEETFDGKW